MNDIFKRLFSHFKEQNIDDSQNPWAGLASYEDPEIAERKLKFCGRDDDSYDLVRLIMGNVFVTLYGKSGIGKTSLLNAGVFPELREEQYTPMSIRLGIRDEEQSYQTIIVETVERIVNRTETVNVIDEQQDQQSVDYLWNYFARHRFYDKYDKPTTPVIVFDQFEEVFRGHRDKAEVLLRQLDYLNDKDHTLDSCEVDSHPYRYEQNFRFVVSIREDDLYHFEDSIDNCYLPALKRCRYRLRSLLEEGARDVILIPGEGLFNVGEKDAIAHAIISKSRNDDGSISTNIISLLCSRIYVDFQKLSVDHISPALVDDFIKGNPFERFYNEATRGFSNIEKSYIEDNLVDSTGRRNSNPESDFLLHVKNGAKLLEGKNRILQRISTSSDGRNNRVELIHDSFCEPLAVLKEKREKRRRLKWMAIAAGIVLLCGVITAYILSMASKNLQLEGTNQKLVDSLTQTLAKVEQERDAARLANRQKDSANTLLAFSNMQLDSSITQLSLRKQQLSVANQGFQTNLSRILAEKALALVDEGDSYLGRLIALQALPPFMPYTREAEIALRKTCVVDEAILRGHHDEVYTTCFSPNGNYIVSGSRDQTIRIWDAKTGGQLGTIRDTNSVRSIAFSPDSKKIVSCSGHTIRILDVVTGEQVGNTLAGHNSVINFVAFSPNGKYIISASGVYNERHMVKRYGYDNSIRIWDSKSGRQIGNPLKGHTGRVNSASFSPDGKLVVSASDDNTIRLWDFKTGRQIGNPLKGHTGRVNSASFSPDGKHIVSSSNDSTIRIWDSKSGKQIGNPLKGHTGRVNSALFSPDGKHVVSASDDNTIRIWGSKLGKQLGNPLVGHTNSVRSVSFSPDGKSVLSASLDNTIRIWDATSRNLFPYQRPTQLVKDCQGYAICADGNYALYLTGENTIKKWDVLKTDFVGDSMKIHTDFSCASLSRNGQYAVLAYKDNTIETWDINTKTRMKKSWKVHSNIVNCLSISPDGKKVISVADKNVTIWDAQLGLQVGDPLLHTQDVTSASFSPDGERIISTSGGIIWIWDVRTGKLTEKFLDGNTYLFSALLSPNGNYIASVAFNSISIWDVNKKEIIGRSLIGRNGPGAIISFSPDSKYLFSSDYSFVKIWDVNTGLLVEQPIGLFGRYYVLYNPIGKIVMLDDVHNSIWTYDFPSLKDLIEQTRERFKNRQLTPEERRKYYLE
ncbi:MAG: WD40 repeat domain-containing protein [Prevotella sp.]|nr:WD40 repeat domain-containing protein [Prevotella sp.]